MKKKKLLVLSSTYPRWQNDPEPAFVHELAKRLTGDFEVHVLCPHAPNSMERETMNGVNIHRFRYAPLKLQTLINNGGMLGNIKKRRWKLMLLPLFFAAQIISTIRFIRRNHMDVIHAHWIIPQGLSLYISKFFCRLPPILLTAHGADLFSLQNPLFAHLKRKAINNASAITVVSNAMLPPLKQLNQLNKSTKVISMGVDLDSTFIIDSEIEKKPYSFLFVGRLVEKKGLKTLLEIWPNIVKKHPSVSLTIIGDGPERKKLETIVTQLKITNSVTFLGAVPHSKLARYYQESEYFAAPFKKTKSGDQEGLGLVLVEALGCGCKVITSDIDACKDVTEHNTNCITYESNNSKSLKSAIETALSNMNFDNQNLETTKNIYNWENIATGYRNKIKSIT